MTATGDRDAPAGRVGLPFDYGTFSDWYDRHRRSVLDPALEAADRRLSAMLAEVLSERDRSRVRPGPSRVKSKERTWRKLRQTDYRARVHMVDDIPHVIDDLLGMRLICTNSRDVDTAQIALDTLPRAASDDRGLLLDPSSERDYISVPKPSGYRGFHVNVILDDPDVAPHRVCCELQVRTLLQDGWGELTHEDSYKTDGPVPPLVSVLSSRMSDLLATLDAIADDLRSELDRLDDASVTGAADATPTATPSDSGDPTDQPDPQWDVAAAELRAHWEDLDQPVELTTLAWELQREFGHDISANWFGAGSFKRFLLAAVPDGTIADLGQPYLLPRDFDPTSASEIARDSSDDGRADDLPAAARGLRRADRSFPLLSTEEWRVLYEELAVAWQPRRDLELTNKTVNQITRSARDRSEANGRPVSRRSLDHVAKTVMFADAPPDPLSADAIARAFSDSVAERMSSLGLLHDDEEAAEVRRWLAAT